MRGFRVGLGMVGIALSIAVAPAAFAVPNHYEIAGGPLSASLSIPDWSFTPACPAD